MLRCNASAVWQPPAAAAFDLLNVAIVETNTSFTISGDLGVSFEVANFLYGTPGDTLADVGTVTFTGYTAPFTTPVITSVSLAGGNVLLQGTNGLAGSGYSVLSSTDLTQPAGSWSAVATGAFDANGNSSNSITINPSESARYYLLQQP